MTVAVTGATGFLGSALVAELITRRKPYAYWRVTAKKRGSNSATPSPSSLAILPMPPVFSRRSRVQRPSTIWQGVSIIPASLLNSTARPTSKARLRCCKPVRDKRSYGASSMPVPRAYMASQVRRPRLRMLLSPPPIPTRPASWKANCSRSRPIGSKVCPSPSCGQGLSTGRETCTCSASLAPSKRAAFASSTADEPHCTHSTSMTW